MQVDAWNLISREQREPTGVLTDNFVQKFDQFLDWQLLSISYFFTMEMLRLYFHRVDWAPILKRQQFSESFLEEMVPSFTESWYIISKYQNLSEHFIHTYQDKVDWTEIFLRQNVSHEFLRDHKKYLSDIDWDDIGLNNTNRRENPKKEKDFETTTTHDKNSSFHTAIISKKFIFLLFLLTNYITVMVHLKSL